MGGDNTNLIIQARECGAHRCFLSLGGFTLSVGADSPMFLSWQ